MFLRLGLCELPHRASDGYWEAAIARSVRPYGAAHHPHPVFGTVGNTADPSRNAHTVQGFARQAHHGVATAFRFLGIALYGFLEC